MSRFRCEQCGRRTRGRPQRTTLNRALCVDCSRDAFAVQLGGIAGLDSGVGHQVLYAVAFRNALRRTAARVRGRGVTSAGRSTPADEAAPR